MSRPGAAARPDFCTQSNYYEECPAQQYTLDLTVDFDRKVLAGHVTIECTLKGDASSLVLDTNGLNIVSAALVAADSSTVSPLEFTLGEKNAALGTPLTIRCPDAPRGSPILVRVDYETSPDSTAIQFLDPAQTAGKKHPYLFTQCQAIHARSLVPCQDTPGQKCPYKATLRVPRDLTGLMSARRVGEPQEVAGLKVYTFEQPLPVPTYLIAIAVGNLTSREIGPRSKVWSEPEMVDAGAFEFSETEQFIAAAEEITGLAYQWDFYDVLLLPPSFPYGGMENPQITFVTPTLLAGDRSLASVVAHEISHSWSGNLVTNATWESFWLNEGFTMFLERKILGRLFGEEFRQFDSILGLNHLKEDVALYGQDHEFTALCPRLENADPDDAFSGVPYEKGYNFLYYLETVVGGPEHFEPFLRHYFATFQFKSLTTDDMKECFLDFFKDSGIEQIASIDWDTWLYKPGMPCVENAYSQKLADGCRDLANKWIAGGEGCSAADLEGWHSRQIVYFLDTLVENADKLSPEVLDKMDEAYGMSKRTNSEERFRWQTLLLRSGSQAVIPSTIAFLKEQGRMKFVRPLFRELNKVARPEALQLFQEHGESYHAIARKMVARDLGV